MADGTVQIDDNVITDTNINRQDAACADHGSFADLYRLGNNDAWVNQGRKSDMAKWRDTADRMLSGAGTPNRGNNPYLFWPLFDDIMATEHRISTNNLPIKIFVVFDIPHNFPCQ